MTVFQPHLKLGHKVCVCRFKVCNEKLTEESKSVHAHFNNVHLTACRKVNKKDHYVNDSPESYFCK